MLSWRGWAVPVHQGVGGLHELDPAWGIRQQNGLLHILEWDRAKGDSAFSNGLFPQTHTLLTQPGGGVTISVSGPR